MTTKQIVSQLNTLLESFENNEMPAGIVAQRRAGGVWVGDDHYSIFVKPGDALFALKKLADVNGLDAHYDNIWETLATAER